MRSITNGVPELTNPKKEEIFQPPPQRVVFERILAVLCGVQSICGIDGDVLTFVAEASAIMFAVNSQGNVLRPRFTAPRHVFPAEINILPVYDMGVATYDGAALVYVLIQGFLTALTVFVKISHTHTHTHTHFLRSVRPSRTTHAPFTHKQTRAHAQAPVSLRLPCLAGLLYGLADTCI
jgi:hypothetical protein